MTVDTTTLNPTKLDGNDLSQNIYFAETDKFIKTEYADELKNGQMLGTTQIAQLFSYKYKQFYMVGQDTYQVQAQYEPLTQKVKVIEAPKKLDVLSGYSAVSDQSKFDDIVDWLKNKELDLQRAVVIRSG